LVGVRPIGQLGGCIVDLGEGDVVGHAVVVISSPDETTNCSTSNDRPVAVIVISETG
jgi:hypothetical protein